MSNRILKEYLKTMSDREKLIWVVGFILLSSGHWIISVIWLLLALEELVEEENKEKETNEDL